MTEEKALEILKRGVWKAFARTESSKSTYAKAAYEELFSAVSVILENANVQAQTPQAS